MLSVALHEYSPHSPALIHAVLNRCFTVVEENEVGGAGDTASDSDSRGACFESGPGKIH
jgi:hypothetical protein